MSKSPQTSHSFRDSVEDVRLALQRYGGEEIKAGEHELHKAVRKLEAQCRPRPRSKQDKLFNPACRLWFACLWASRDNSRSVQRLDETKEENEALGDVFKASFKAGFDLPSDPALALYWADKLSDELYSWYDEKYVRDLRERVRRVTT